MPELPEVETSRRGIEPFLVGKTVKNVIVRERRLRWPVPRTLDKELPGQRINSVDRRAKYILINTDVATAILHLGMSGHVSIIDTGTPAGVHDHIDIELDSGVALRLRDPRRFGSLHWSKRPMQHKLIKHLGPEPLGPELSGDYLYERSRGRKLAVKQFIMDAAIVVGVGNIYASESLFLAGIHPTRPAGRISRERYRLLARAIVNVLERAIDAGGTTLRDFYGGDGQSGYFQQQLDVYGRADEDCNRCGATIRSKVLGQRNTFYCVNCQR